MRAVTLAAALALTAPIFAQAPIERETGDRVVVTHTVTVERRGQVETHEVRRIIADGRVVEQSGEPAALHALLRAVHSARPAPRDPEAADSPGLASPPLPPFPGGTIGFRWPQIAVPHSQTEDSTPCPRCFRQREHGQPRPGEKAQRPSGHPPRRVGGARRDRRGIAVPLPQGRMLVIRGLSGTPEPSPPPESRGAMAGESEIAALEEKQVRQQALETTSRDLSRELARLVQRIAELEERLKGLEQKEP